MLKKWLYSNLLSSVEKSYAQEMVAAAQEFPAGVLERFPAAIENDNMVDTVDQIVDLIADDGFPEWGEARRKSTEPLSTIAANWTALRMVRHIIESGVGAVLATDRTFPIVRYSVINNLIDSCPTDMKGLYLHWTGDPDPYLIPYNGYGEEHVRAMAACEPCGVPGLLSNFAGVGFCVYFHPSGAADFLEAWRAKPEIDRQSVLIYTKYPVSGYYTCNPNLVLSVPAFGKGIISEYNPVLVKDHRH